MDCLRLPDSVWRSENNYCHPPWDLLDDLTLKLHRSGAAATVVAPCWPTRSRHQQLLEMATEVEVYPASPRTLPSSRARQVRYVRTRSMAHSGVPDSLPAWRDLNFRSLSALQPRSPPAGVQPLSAVSRRGKVRYTLLPPRAKASHVDAVLPCYVAWLGNDQLGR